MLFLRIWRNIYTYLSHSDTQQACVMTMLTPVNNYSYSYDNLYLLHISSGLRQLVEARTVITCTPF